MTRETKIGLVVGGAFVILLAVVIVNRMQESPPEVKPDTPTVVRSDPKGAAPKRNDKDVTPKSGVVPAAAQEPGPLKLETVAPGQSPPAQTGGPVGLTPLGGQPVVKIIDLPQPNQQNPLPALPP